MLTFCILGASLASPLFLQLPPQDIGTEDENAKEQGDLDRGPAPRRVTKMWYDGEETPAEASSLLCLGPGLSQGPLSGPQG